MCNSHYIHHLSHPATQQLQQLDAYKTALQDQKAMQFQAGLKLVEAQLGLSWQSAWEVVAAEGIAVALDGPTQGICLLVKSRDADALKKLKEDVFVWPARTQRIRGKAIRTPRRSTAA